MRAISRLPALLTLLLACSGCADQQLSVASSVVTSAGSVILGSATPQSHFVAGEYVRVVVYVTWPDVTRFGGDHHLDWNWYRGSQLVSHNHFVRIRFNYSPAELSSQRAAAALGPGDYHVDTVVDDKVLSSNSFSISAQRADDHAEQTICALPSDPNQARLQLQPTYRGSNSPAYPADALTHEVPGCAVVKVAIDGTGVPNIGGIVAERPNGWAFGDSAVAMVKTQRYPPAHGGWYKYVNVTFRVDAGDPRKTAANHT